MSQLSEQFGKDGLAKDSPSPNPSPSVSNTNINQQSATFPAPEITPAANSGRNVSDCVAASLARAADNGGPREAVGQQKSSQFETDSAPATTENFEGVGG